MDMPFFEFKQNNTGGSFDFDADAGISVVVIIEAEDSDQANGMAEGLGLYFNGYGDCECCGSRWYEAYGEGDDIPSHHGDPIQDVNFGSYPNFKWIKDGPEAYVHFA